MVFFKRYRAINNGLNAERRGEGGRVTSDNNTHTHTSQIKQNKKSHSWRAVEFAMNDLGFRIVNVLPSHLTVTVIRVFYDGRFSLHFRKGFHLQRRLQYVDREIEGGQPHLNMDSVLWNHGDIWTS